MANEAYLVEDGDAKQPRVWSKAHEAVAAFGKQGVPFLRVVRGVMDCVLDDYLRVPGMRRQRDESWRKVPFNVSCGAASHYTTTSSK